MTATPVLKNALSQNANEGVVLVEPLINVPNCVVLTGSVRISNPDFVNARAGLCGDVCYLNIAEYATGKYLVKIRNWKKNLFNFVGSENPFLVQTDPDMEFDYSKIVYVQATFEDSLYTTSNDWPNAPLPAPPQLENFYFNIWWWKPELYTHLPVPPVPDPLLETGILISCYKYSDNTAVSAINKRLNIEIIFQDNESGGVKFT